jgi:peptidoglycan/LPS O-acetylase OafA/YrhL
MRAVAASSIVVYHVWAFGAGSPDVYGIDFGRFGSKFFDNLRAGVTLFFVLSGFLLYRPFVASLVRDKPFPSIKQYLRNRALRILPAYWFILLFLTIVFQRELLGAPAQLLANVFFAQNYVPAYHVINGWEGLGIGPAWSLAIEVVFYLTLPVVAAFALLLTVRRGFSPLVAGFAPVALLLVVGLGAKIALRLYDVLGRTWDQMGFPSHADWFAVGMALAILRVLWEDGRLSLPPWWRAGAILAIVGIVGVSGPLWQSGTLEWNEYQSLVGIACGLLLALVVFANAGSRLVRFLEWRPILAAGLASYSVFLWNDPILRELRGAGWTIDGRAGFIPNLLLLAVVVGIASTLTYLFVEKPALGLKRSVGERVPQPSVEPEPMGSLEESDLRPSSAGSASRA